MKELVADFPKQLEGALNIASAISLHPSNNTIQNVLITGLGGSGIGGSIIAELTVQEAKVPVSVSKTYFIPDYVNENTLVIACSYSGNTEETINALSLAIQKKAKITCITSGGKITETAKEKNLDLISIPGGMPPRACLGYSLTQLFAVLAFHQIIGGGWKEALKGAIELLNKENNSIQKKAKALAEHLHNKIPVIYSTTYYEGVAIRFRQQINENGKMLCWHHAFPEMNHNELVGWRIKNEQLAVVMFRDEEDFERNQTRFEICKEIIKDCTANIKEIYTVGKNAIEKSIYLIHLGDWASVYLAEMRGVDATEVKVIDKLKSALAEV